MKKYRHSIHLVTLLLASLATFSAPADSTYNGLDTWLLECAYGDVSDCVVYARDALSKRAKGEGNRALPKTSRQALEIGCSRKDPSSCLFLKCLKTSCPFQSLETELNDLCFSKNVASACLSLLLVPRGSQEEVALSETPEHCMRPKSRNKGRRSKNDDSAAECQKWFDRYNESVIAQKELQKKRNQESQKLVFRACQNGAIAKCQGLKYFTQDHNEIDEIAKSSCLSAWKNSLSGPLYCRLASMDASKEATHHILSYWCKLTAEECSAYAKKFKAGAPLTKRTLAACNERISDSCKQLKVSDF
jgi:hypothetical protein